jgi:hypothetical protein
MNSWSNGNLVADGVLVLCLVKRFTLSMFAADICHSAWYTLRAHFASYMVGRHRSIYR